MNIFSNGLATSFFKHSGKWLSTPYEYPTKPYLQLAFTLRNILIWLLIINITNYYILSVKLYFGDIDVVAVLANTNRPYATQYSEQVSKSLEDILINIYVRNEAIYLDNMNYTTITVTPTFEIRDGSISSNLQEGFFTNVLFKDTDKSKIHTSIKQKLPDRFPAFHVGRNRAISEEFLITHLGRLYLGSINAPHTVNQVSQTLQHMSVAKFGMFIISIVILVLNLSIFFYPKVLVWHYGSLFVLYTVNFTNLAFILVIIITRQSLTRNRDYQFVLLMLEMVSILAFNMIFFNSHQVIMENYLMEVSATSSVYSDTDVKSMHTKQDTEYQLSTGDGLSGRTATKNLAVPKKGSPVGDCFDNEAGSRRCFTAPIKSSTNSSYLSGKLTSNYTQKF
ncbi:hypothetical protein KGF56_002802 [Candida oxycetoniae]|uniref:Uncharacterized protein n=1 Tax=Candida oxycetoniae TaxID=497107 RepID=A0AAI9SX73_9ASCO|nr:uncharacterized protein KGF56_002802 [Candida oxycetoniae]KAI3404405.2 hypothetical protein KGF56_002802 [Candida oxycetoniae]